MRALVGFTGWFLTVMLDQIRFTRAMLDLERLRQRYLALARDVTGDERIERLFPNLFSEAPIGAPAPPGPPKLRA